MCMDFRTLNQYTHKGVYPIPCIEDLLDKLAHANWFSKMDLIQVYHQIQITPAH